MSTDTLPSPEGALIRRTRERAIPRISIRAAAARVAISPEHWGNVERGYKSVRAGDDPLPVEASAELLAKMARAVGVTADQMETEGRRPDAAGVLRENPAPARRPVAAPPGLLEMTEALKIAAAPHVAEIELRLEYARRRYPGQELRGEMVFPVDSQAAQTWDDLTALRWPEPAIVAGIAAMQAWEQEAAGLAANE